MFSFFPFVYIFSNFQIHEQLVWMFDAKNRHGFLSILCNSTSYFFLTFWYIPISLFLFCFFFFFFFLVIAKFSCSHFLTCYLLDMRLKKLQRLTKCFLRPHDINEIPSYKPLVFVYLDLTKLRLFNLIN